MLLIADEPTDNLDPKVSDGILELPIDINKSDTDNFMGTHDHSFLDTHPSRLLKYQQEKFLN